MTTPYGLQTLLAVWCFAVAITLLAGQWYLSQRPQIRELIYRKHARAEGDLLLEWVIAPTIGAIVLFLVVMGMSPPEQSTEPGESA
jgi:putative copper export protein